MPNHTMPMTERELTAVAELIGRVERETDSFGVYVDDGMCMRGSVSIGDSGINWRFPINPAVATHASEWVVSEILAGIQKERDKCLVCP